MNIQNVDADFPFIIIDNYYDEEEQTLIWDELNFLCNKDALYFGSDPKTGGAKGKNNYSVFLDALFSYNRNFSRILTLNRKLFAFWDQIIKQNNHWLYKNFECNCDFTMVSYYEKNNCYPFHTDSSVLTSLTWFYKEPKKFEGGNLQFKDDLKIEILNNRMVIFPSMIPHSVDTVIMKDEDLDKKFGRFCITQFLCVEPASPK